jgi:hypothetical protein
MNVQNLANRPVLALLVLIGGIVPGSTAAQTVLGPEYTLTKSTVSSVQRGERQCDYFLWTKLGGTSQRVSFSYLDQAGKSETEAPQIETLRVVINPAKNVPTARMTGKDDSYRTTWMLEMSRTVYEASKSCLVGISVSQGTSN